MCFGGFIPTDKRVRKRGGHNTAWQAKWRVEAMAGRMLGKLCTPIRVSMLCTWRRLGEHRIERDTLAYGIDIRNTNETRPKTQSSQKRMSAGCSAVGNILAHTDCRYTRVSATGREKTQRLAHGGAERGLKRAFDRASSFALLLPTVE